MHRKLVVTDLDNTLLRRDKTIVRRAEAVAEIISRYPEFDAVNFTGEDWYQIKSRKAAKHYALAEVCRQLGIALSEVVSFGDDYNDIEMLRICGAGVAVSNAIEECKSSAAFICGDCDYDGVAVWLEDNLL